MRCTSLALSRPSTSLVFAVDKCIYDIQHDRCASTADADRATEVWNCIDSLRSTAEGVHRNLPMLQSHSFRAQQLHCVHLDVACTFSKCARLLLTLRHALALSRSRCSLLRGGSASYEILHDESPRCSPVSRILLSALLVAENVLLARGAPLVVVQASFRSPRLRALESTGLPFGSLIDAFPRMVRDIGTNTDEVRLAHSTKSHFFVNPAFRTYASEAALQSVFGHDNAATAAAYVVMTRSAEKMAFSDAGKKPRRHDWSPDVSAPQAGAVCTGRSFRKPATIQSA